VPIVIMLGLLGLFNSFGEKPKPAEDQDVFANMRESCTSGAAKSMQQNGADLSAADVKAKIDKNCSCFVLEVQTQYTPDEFAKISTLDRASLANDPKFSGLIDKCTKAADQP
jgi:hypothetical protein